MDLKEIGTNMRNWVDSAQNRDYWKALVNVALSLRIPYSEAFSTPHSHPSSARIFASGSCYQIDVNEGNWIDSTQDRDY